MGLTHMTKMEIHIIIKRMKRCKIHVASMWLVHDLETR